MSFWYRLVNIDNFVVNTILAMPWFWEHLEPQPLPNVEVSSQLSKQAFNLILRRKVFTDEKKLWSFQWIPRIKFSTGIGRVGLQTAFQFGRSSSVTSTTFKFPRFSFQRSIQDPWTRMISANHPQDLHNFSTFQGNLSCKHLKFYRRQIHEPIFCKSSQCMPWRL